MHVIPTAKGSAPRLSRFALFEALKQGGVPEEQHLPLWQLVLSAHQRGASTQRTPGVRMGRPGWTKEAAALLNPLRTYTYQLRTRRSAFHARFRGLFATDPKGNRHHLPDVFDLYLQRCEDIAKRIEATLKAHGHQSNDATGHVDFTLSDVVRELRQLGEHAGAHHWSQWENPKTVRAIRYLLGQMYDAYEAATGQQLRARRWYAYENGLKEQRARQEWEAAFDLWLDGLRAAYTENVHAKPMLDYLASPGFKQECDDATQAHRAAGRTPKSYPLGQAWQALSVRTRLYLAQLHQPVIDAAIADGALPSTTVSPFQPSDDELRAQGVQA